MLPWFLLPASFAVYNLLPTLIAYYTAQFGWAMGTILAFQVWMSL